MVHFGINRLCFCGFDPRSISEHKTYSTMRAEPIINHSQMAYFLDPISRFRNIVDNFKYDADISSPRILESRRSFVKSKNNHKDSKENKVNTNSSEYDNLSMRMNWSDDWNFSIAKKNTINKSLYENFDFKTKKERSHTYSISDHISQMSTWQNSLILEFGMLPTLPCISYFSVLDSSDDECSDISCNESIISTSNLNSTFSNNISHIAFSDMDITNVPLKIPLFNSIGFPEIMTCILSNSSEYFKTATTFRYNGIKTSSSKTAVSSKYNSFGTITSKKRFKFKFPKIKHTQKYSEDGFTEIIIPAKHDNMDSPKIKIVSKFPDDNIKSDYMINSDSNIKLDIISTKKKKFKQDISSVSNIKQDNIVKNKNFFRKFSLKSLLKKTKAFKNKGTQTGTSVFNDVLFKESRASTKELLYSQDIFQGDNYNLNENIDIYYEHKDIYSNPKTTFSHSDSLSLTPKYVISRTGKLKKALLDRSIASDIDIPEYYESPKQSKCYCTCTCLCGACCTFSGSKHVLKRPPSVVFVEIAASRRADSSDTIDFNGDFDEKAVPNPNLTYISSNSLINQKELEFNALTLELTRNDDLKLDPKLNNHYFEHQPDKNDGQSESEFLSNSIIDSYDIMSPKLNNN
ncbi:hypothetical protein MERGE_001952 [Pneumocystis wakefieldiae]|uniref:Uncharacterized protein n=1 Tax=Pneumocystis wakefieldiae TaxID=38082 RepID=A0A899FKV6_9ASCO|nr:hypothetical protein MERGE_001952 [Pneumocystis wakefieldiae]